MNITLSKEVLYRSYMFSGAPCKAQVLMLETPNDLSCDLRHPNGYSQAQCQSIQRVTLMTLIYALIPIRSVKQAKQLCV